ncbi:hypothetical protein ACFL3C_01425 [Patescibacteria group bacterium]
MATVGGPTESGNFGWYKDGYGKARETADGREDQLPGAIQSILAHKADLGTLTPEEETIRNLVRARLTVTELMASKK